MSAGAGETRRSREEMLQALKRQVRLLRDYAQKAFIEGNADYAGEVATKLRLLVTKFRFNEPLLLRLMQETGLEPKIRLQGPPIPLTPAGHRAGDEISLEEYLNLDAIGMRVPSGSFVILSKVNFVRAIAEQAGGSHEDWEMDEILATILSSRIFIMGQHASLAELQTTVDAVLNVAERFLKHCDAQTKT